MVRDTLMCARFLRPYAHPRMHPNQFCYHQLDQIYYLGLLDRCTTKHEVQTLLQTKMDSGHMDANFNIAILDCHKVGVAFLLSNQMIINALENTKRSSWRTRSSNKCCTKNGASGTGHCRWEAAGSEDTTYFGTELQSHMFCARN